MRSVLCAMLMLMAAAPPAARAQTTEQAVQALHFQDERLARIMAPLLLANRELCPALMPLTGMVLHSGDQYGEAGQALFTGPAVAIAAVAASSAAAAAGIKAGDGLLVIGGTQLAQFRPRGPVSVRDQVHDLLASQPAEDAVIVSIERNGHAQDITVRSAAACRALVEITASEKPTAFTDGRIIQISYALAASLTDEELAVVAGHELAHLVLEHGRRLEEAGISSGIRGEIGKHRRANRRAEVEADLLSVHLLANAGYSPHSAPQYWRSAARHLSGSGALRSRIYPAPSARATAMEAEIAEYLPQGSGFSWPAHLLATRTDPF